MLELILQSLDSDYLWTNCRLFLSFFQCEISSSLIYGTTPIYCKMLSSTLNYICAVATSGVKKRGLVMQKTCEKRQYVILLLYQ